MEGRIAPVWLEDWPACTLQGSSRSHNVVREAQRTAREKAMTANDYIALALLTVILAIIGVVHYPFRRGRP